MRDMVSVPDQVSAREQKLGRELEGRAQTDRFAFWTQSPTDIYAESKLYTPSLKLRMMWMTFKFARA